MKQLHFGREVVFQKSFARSNLSYLVYHEEDKLRRMKEILRSVNGSAIVYVRNRKRTREYAEFLQKEGISSDFYHAGLSIQLRDQKQEAWKKNATRVMVCTNAFGMGIDKPDVRVVIHSDLPDSLEAYYQEAGRAGRDEKAAFAVVLYQQKDIAEIRSRQQTAFPSMKEIRQVYQALANYLQVPVDSGMGVSFDFEIARFLTQYDLNPVIAANCLKHLETEGLISLTDAVLIPSRIHIRVNNMELYDFQVKHPRYDALIKMILRSTEGVFDDFAKINEPELADRLLISFREVVKKLEYLSDAGIIHYEKRKDSPQLIFLTPREDASYLNFDQKKYQKRKMRYIDQTNAVISYVTSATTCRSMQLLEYFGETADARCGVCDFCRNRNKIQLNEVELEYFKTKITGMLKKTSMEVDELLDGSGLRNRKLALEALEWMVDQDLLEYNGKGQLQLPRKK